MVAVITPPSQRSLSVSITNALHGRNIYEQSTRWMHNFQILVKRLKVMEGRSP